MFGRCLAQSILSAKSIKWKYIMKETHQMLWWGFHRIKGIRRIVKTIIMFKWRVLCLLSLMFRSDQSLSHVRLYATPWIAACQASLSITNSRSSLRLTSIESVMPSSHLILCRPLLPLPPIPPSIRVFSNESTLHMRWPKYWSFSFSIIPSKVLC